MGERADLLAILEPEQVRGGGRCKLPRRRLGRGALALLVLLRVYVIVAIPIVVYAFIHALATTPK